MAVPFVRFGAARVLLGLTLLLGLVGSGGIAVSTDAVEPRITGAHSGGAPSRASAASATSDVRVDDAAAVTADRAGLADSFTFAAAGDLGANSSTAASLAVLDRSSARFFLALGDLDYDQTPSDAAWCTYVKSRLPTKGPSFPFELVVGNHEMDGGPDGRLVNFTACLPDRLRSTVGPGAVYGAESAFTYPARNPYARFITISPNMTVAGTRFTYGKGSAHRAWLRGQIRAARAAGQWVIVNAHYPCLTTGTRHGCDSGETILNFLVRKKVDLVLHGHNHLYERSRQLRLRPRGGCASISSGAFDSDCVTDRGGDGTYTRGAGTVMVTAGSFGRLEPVETTVDPESRYFAVTNARSSGFVRYVVTPTSISARFLASRGPLNDSFRITTG